MVKKLEDRPSSVNRSERPKRVPIHGYRNIMGVAGLEKGWHYAWINDDMVDRMLAAYYDFVEHEVIIGDRKVDAASSIGGKISKAVGNGVTAYLMRCPQEVKDEEDATLNAEIDASEETIRGHKGQEGRYGDIKIAQNKPLGK